MLSLAQLGGCLVRRASTSQPPQYCYGLIVLLGACLLLLAISAAPASAQISPPTNGSEVKVPDSCVVDSCQVSFKYLHEGASRRYTVEVEWDHRGNTRENFRPTTVLKCSHGVPPNEAYPASECAATSPVYTRASEEAFATVLVFRITAEDGSQGWGSESFTVKAKQDLPSQIVVKAPRRLSLPRSPITVYTPKRVLRVSWQSSKGTRFGKFGGEAMVKRSAQPLFSGHYAGSYRYRVRLYAPKGQVTLRLEAHNGETDFADYAERTLRVRRFRGGPYAGFRFELVDQSDGRQVAFAGALGYVSLKPSRMKVALSLVKGGSATVLRKSRDFSVKPFLTAYSLDYRGASTLHFKQSEWQTILSEACAGTKYHWVGTYQVKNQQGKVVKRGGFRKRLVPPAC